VNRRRGREGRRRGEVEGKIGVIYQQARGGL
jgi:hypothetical protein